MAVIQKVLLYVSSDNSIFQVNTGEPLLLHPIDGIIDIQRVLNLLKVLSYAQPHFWVA